MSRRNLDGLRRRLAGLLDECCCTQHLDDLLGGAAGGVVPVPQRVEDRVLAGPGVAIEVAAYCVVGGTPLVDEAVSEGADDARCGGNATFETECCGVLTPAPPLHPPPLP